MKRFKWLRGFGGGLVAGALLAVGVLACLAVVISLLPDDTGDCHCFDLDGSPEAASSADTSPTNAVPLAEERCAAPHAYMFFSLSEKGALPLYAYSRLRLFSGWDFKGRCRDGRCLVTVPAVDGHPEEEVDVSDHVRRALKAMGCDGRIARTHSLELDPRTAVWPIRPGVALAVGEFGISGTVGQPFDDFHLSQCALLLTGRVATDSHGLSRGP